MLLLPVGAELIQFEEAGWTSGSRVNFAAENPGLPIHRAALIQHDLDGLVIIAHALAVESIRDGLHPGRFLGAVGEVERDGVRRAVINAAAPREEVYTCGNGYCSGGSEPKQCAA